jgi:hypothetical protein
LREQQYDQRQSQPFGCGHDGADQAIQKTYATVTRVPRRSRLLGIVRSSRRGSKLNQKLGSPIIPVPPLVSGRTLMPAHQAPGWLIDAEIHWQSAECSVGCHCATTVECPIGGRARWLLGGFRDWRWPGHFLLAGPCRSRRSFVDTRPRRHLKCQPHNIRHQLRDRDDHQNQTNADALRHVLLLPWQAT